MWGRRGHPKGLVRSYPHLLDFRGEPPVRVSKGRAPGSDEHGIKPLSTRQILSESCSHFMPRFPKLPNEVVVRIQCDNVCPVFGDSR